MIEHHSRYLESTPASSNGMLIVFTGPTAAGKDTICQNFINKKPSFNKIVSFTTRPQKLHEQSGIHYDFIDQKIFFDMKEAGQFVMTSQYGNYFYATPKSAIRSVLTGGRNSWVISIRTAGQLESIIRNPFNEEEAVNILQRTVTLFIGVERLLVLKSRFRQRDKTTTPLLNRLHDDWDAWITYGSNFRNVLINKTGNIESTTNEAIELIDSFDDRLVKNIS